MANLFEKIINAAKSVLLLITFSAIGIFLLFIFRKYLPKSEELKPDSSWVETVGTVSKIGYGRGGVGLIDYKYCGNYYREYNGLNEGRIVGERYMLVINPKQPKQFIEKYWNPIFLEGEETGFTKGFVNKRYKKYALPDSSDEYGTEYGVDYTYKVEGLSYFRQQDLPPQSWELEKQVKKGDCFEVEYLLANPQRAALHFNKPCNR